MNRDIEERYYGIKKDLADYVIPYLTGIEVQTNASRGALICNNEDSDPSLYWVTVNAYSYSLDAARLANLFERTQQILDDWLLEGGPSHIWAGEYVETEYRRGTQYAHTNLAAQSELYAQQTTLSQLLFSQPYQLRIGIAYAQTYSEWKGLSDAARADLANVISDAVARGISPRETAKIISQRLDVSMSRAKNMAQTEQVGAYRKAQWGEDADAELRLGIKTRFMWFSALKPTTRSWHAYRHGRVYTRKEVMKFYSENGNRYNCYCSQQSVLVDDSGKPQNPKLIEKLIKERQVWAGNIDFISSPRIKISKLPAKADQSVSEIEAWMRGRVSEDVLFPQGTDIEAARVVANTMSEAFTRFNAPPVKMVGDLGLGGLGAYDSDTQRIHIIPIALDKNTWTVIARDSAKKNYKQQALIDIADYPDAQAIRKAINSIDILPYSAIQTIRGTVAHEAGHHVFYQNLELLDKLSKEASAKGWGFALSFYSQKNHKEIFAESFSLYLTGNASERARIYPPLLKWLIDHDLGKIR